MRNFYKLVSILFLTTSSLVSAQSFDNGVFVMNEGGFSAGNASMSFISNTDQLQNDVYSPANSGNSLGDTAQHMVFKDDHAYVVLNGTGSLKIINRYTLALEHTISGFVNPRYLVFNDEGYLFVSCWGNPSNTTDDYIAVVDLTTNSILTTISVVEGPERMIEKNGRIYVAHTGGYGYGTSVSVIDPIAFAVTSSITVGDSPNSIAEKDGILYVLSGGKPSWSGSETFGSLLKYDLNTNTPLSTIAYPGQHPSNMRIAGNNLYYTSGTGIFKVDVSFTTLPTTALFNTINDQNVYGVYGLDIIDSKIYVADAGDYFNPGHAYVYSDAGTLLNTFTVGIIPNGFYKAEANLAVIDHDLAVNLIAYPNPTTDLLYLNTQKAATIRMFDIAGRNVKTQEYQANGINVSDLNKGIYLVEITIENKKTVQRIIVN